MLRTVTSNHTIEADVPPELLGAGALAGLFTGSRAGEFEAWLRESSVRVDEADTTRVAFRCTAEQLHAVATEARKYNLGAGELSTSLFFTPAAGFESAADELVRANWASRGKTGFISWAFDAAIVQLPEQDGDMVSLTLYANTTHTITVDENNDPDDKERKELAVTARKKRTSLFIGIPMVGLIVAGVIWTLGLATGLIDPAAGKWAMVSVGVLTFAGMVGAVLGGLPAKRKRGTPEPNSSAE